MHGIQRITPLVLILLEICCFPVNSLRNSGRMGRNSTEVLSKMFQHPSILKKVVGLPQHQTHLEESTCRHPSERVNPTGCEMAKTDSVSHRPS